MPTSTCVLKKNFKNKALLPCLKHSSTARYNHSLTWVTSRWTDAPIQGNTKNWCNHNASWEQSLLTYLHAHYMFMLKDFTSNWTVNCICGYTWMPDRFFFSMICRTITASFEMHAVALHAVITVQRRQLDHIQKVCKMHVVPIRWYVR